jgi:hypothetical protein
MLNRRDFLSNMMLGFVPAFATYEQLLELVSLSVAPASPIFENGGFHFFDDSLASLHFYFINAQVKENSLVKKKADIKGYMIIRLPQQHLQEQFFRDGEVNEASIAKSRLSGFSYLAFEIFPLGEDPKRPKRSSIPFKIENLLDWNNSDYFKLMVSDKLNKFTNSDWTDFKNADELMVKQDAADSNLDFYKKTCERIFEGDGNFPVTLLEIPQGMFLTPVVRQEQDTITSVNITNSNIGRRHYIYNADAMRIHRSVREIWNASMFFEKRLKAASTTAFDMPLQREDPVFRAVAYGGEKKLNSPNEIWRPDFMDVQSLVYLTSLARKGVDNVSVNEEPIYDIRAEKLRFTGLGAITHLYYKNFNPPPGINLVEYEHHITLGRDEYVKISKLGVISVTGQKALFTQIGQRKIKDGICYVEFKEYVEIIQKQINYYDPTLFQSDPQLESTGEPVNFIGAMKQWGGGSDIRYGGFFDEPLSEYKRKKDKRFLFPQGNNFLETHFRRFPFKKTEAISVKGVPIRSDKDRLMLNGTVAAFWPVLENRVEQDLRLDFRSYDWSNRIINFNAPFMFIFKDVIDGQNEEDIKQIYSYFLEATHIDKQQSEQKSYRRKINFNNQAIAYTIDDTPTEKSAAGKELEQFSNKSNVAPTEFIEYYFTIAKDVKPLNGESIFNLRYFPLFPQVRKSKVYLENIKSYSSQPLPSLINYNEDYIKFALKREDTTHNPPPYTPYNKAKLVFDHTTDFIENADDDAKDGYEKIKRVFADARERIGGLVNPDIQIESVGLIKQGIAVGKNLNEKYKNLQDEFGRPLNKITSFSLRDLLKGKSAEILGGVSLLDILEEVLPDDKTPMTEIKNFSARLEELESNVAIQEIKKQAHTVQVKLKQLDQAVETARRNLEIKEKEIKNIKVELEANFKLSRIRQLLENTMEESHLLFFITVDPIGSQIQIDEEQAIDYLTTKLIAQIEKIRGLKNWLLEAERDMSKVPEEYKPLIIQAAADFDYDFLTNVALSRYSSVRIRVGYLVKAKVTLFEDLILKEKAVEQAKVVLLGAMPKTSIYDNALEAYKAAESAALEVRNEFNKELINYLQVKKLIDEAKKKGTERLEYFKQLNAVYEVLTVTQLPYYLATLASVRKDIESLIRKLPSRQASGFHVDAILGTQREELISLRKNIIRAIKAHVQKIKSSYEQNESDLAEVIETVNQEVMRQESMLKGSIETYLEKIDVLKRQFIRIKDASAVAENLGKIFQDEQRKYEGYLKEQLKNESNSIVQQVQNYIKEQEDALRIEVNKTVIKEISGFIQEGKRVLQYLSALSRQEIVYTWKTNNFRDANFGLLTFTRSNNPSTQLLVNVRSTVLYKS